MKTILSVLLLAGMFAFTQEPTANSSVAQVASGTEQPAKLETHAPLCESYWVCLGTGAQYSSRRECRSFCPGSCDLITYC
jgi:hypothetical protein